MGERTELDSDLPDTQWRQDRPRKGEGWGFNTYLGVCQGVLKPVLNFLPSYRGSVEVFIAVEERMQGLLREGTSLIKKPDKKPCKLSGAKVLGAEEAERRK